MEPTQPIPTQAQPIPAQAQQTGRSTIATRGASVMGTPARPRRTREVSPIQLPATPEVQLPRRSARLTESDISNLALPDDSGLEAEGDTTLITIIPDDDPARQEIDSIPMAVPRKGLLSSDFYIPWSYQDAITCPDAPKWVKAIEREA